MFKALMRRIDQWQCLRRDIRRLQRIDDRLLDDMGIARESIARRVRGR